MKFGRISPLASQFVLCTFLIAAPAHLAAQDQTKHEQPAQNAVPEDSTSHRTWTWLKQGKISFSARYRFEAFERDGAPFTAPAYAPTLRILLGYATPEFHGFSLFASGESVTVTGPADYNDPTRPSQDRPGRPAILDPRSLQLNQGYLQWEHGIADKKVSVTLGRQELSLNDGRFLSVSYWRQVHGTFDAARIDGELPHHFSFTYAFINRAYRVVGYDATDGKPAMHTHMYNLKWNRPGKINAALYGLLLDYRAPAQFTFSTQTYGLRLNGPCQFGKDWNLVYTAEYAKQKNYGSNPDRVDANYYLGEIGPGWRDYFFKAGYALLGGRSLTDKLSTPLAPPFNGWTDLFVNNPSAAGGNGLEARYLYARGPVPHVSGLTATEIFYDYHSDNLHVHYGSEFDSALAYKVTRISDRWEIGWRFGRYWTDRLFSNAIRTSIYTSFTL